MQGWGNGSIVIVMESKQFKGADIFPYCYNPDVLDTSNTGEIPAAVRYCKDAAKRNKVALCLSVSNGTEYMTVYAPGGILKELFDLAVQQCLKSKSDTLYKQQKKQRSLSR